MKSPVPKQPELVNRKPDLVLKCMDKTTGAKSGRLGVGWINADHSISLILDPGVALVGNKETTIMLFPKDDT